MSCDINPPPPRQRCEGCGPLINGKHTSIVCKFLQWIDKHFGVEL